MWCWAAFLKMMKNEMTSFRLVVFIWNEIVGVVLSNCFRKRNETKISRIFFFFFFNDEKIYKKIVLGKIKFFGKMLFRNVLSCRLQQWLQKKTKYLNKTQKVHFDLIIISFWLFKGCGTKLITVCCQPINILYKCNYLFTGIFLYISYRKLSTLLFFFKW